jgi:DNA-binding NtrC family response regulator
MPERLRILIVDDEAVFLKDISSFLENRYDLTLARSAEAAIDKIKGTSFDAVLLDISFGKGMDGFDALDEIRAIEPGLPVIMVTRDASAASAAAAFKRGAVDYIDKQPSMAVLERKITRALEEQRLLRSNQALTDEVESLRDVMVGESEPMRILRREIAAAAQGISPILIVGENGTGKELVAREIWRQFSPGKPYVPVNCAAIPAGIFEAALFGHEKGVFTDAKASRAGKFELANGGAILLDEITEIAPDVQAKLLRVIEDRTFERVGNETRKMVRFSGKILASTNRDIERLVASGTFRSDLYYRFSTYVIKVPPLRGHREDIPALVEYFSERISKELKKPKPRVDAGTMTRLCTHDWPGNVRELENVIEAFVVRGELAVPKALKAGCADGEKEIHYSGMDYDAAKKLAMRAFQKSYIEPVIASCGGDLDEAARRMGLSKFGLQKILKDIRGE